MRNSSLQSSGKYRTAEQLPDFPLFSPQRSIHSFTPIKSIGTPCRAKTPGRQVTVPVPFSFNQTRLKTKDCAEYLGLNQHIVQSKGKQSMSIAHKTDKKRNATPLRPRQTPLRPRHRTDVSSSLVGQALCDILKTPSSKFQTPNRTALKELMFCNNNTQKKDLSVTESSKPSYCLTQSSSKTSHTNTVTLSRKECRPDSQKTPYNNNKHPSSRKQLDRDADPLAKTPSMFFSPPRLRSSFATSSKPKYPRPKPIHVPR